MSNIELYKLVFFNFFNLLTKWKIKILIIYILGVKNLIITCHEKCMKFNNLQFYKIFMNIFKYQIVILQYLTYI